MPDHYFTQNPATPHNTQEIKFQIRDKAFRFVTDTGVFSKERVDYGSELLIDAVIDDIGGKTPPSILDLGCGFGAIGITLAAFCSGSDVLMCDINTRAVDLCTENIRLNGIGNASAVVSNGVPPSCNPDIIVCNPPIRAGKAVVYTLFSEAHEKLGDGGTLYIVIRKKQGAPSAKAYLETLFGQVDTVGRGAGYHVIKALV